VLFSILPISGSELTVREEEQVDQMARSLAWRVRRVFDALSEPGVKEALATDFAAIVRAAEVVHRWVNLVGVVVHQAEAHYGPGTGPLKARVARAVILRMVRQSGLQIPGLPTAFEPIVYDYVIRVSIDVVVALHNSNDLWPPSAAARASIVPGPARFWARVRGAINDWLCQVAWLLVLRSEPIPASIEAEIAAAMNPRLVDEVKTGFAACLRLIMGVGVDRAFVTTMVEVVSVAVRDAEAMTAWDGPTKRAFATKLILSMMEEFNWIPEGAWYRGPLEGMLGVVIDITIEQLNRGNPSWNTTPHQRTLAASNAAS
jgi:hypothetical protein